MRQQIPQLGDLGDLTPPVEAKPLATLTPDKPAEDREALPVLGLTVEDVGEQAFGDLNENLKRQVGAHARALSQDPTFLIACNGLTREYVKRFLQLSPKSPGFADQCMRANLACNVVGDVLAQLALMAEHNRVPNENIDNTMRGPR
jgi:hypothetical protein